MTQRQYVEAIEQAVARARDAETAKQAAVAAARLAGVPWTAIGDALGVTRQAARERYIAVDQVSKAWKAVESHLAEVARRRNLLASTAEMVDRLVDEKSLNDRDVHDLRLLLRRYSEAMQGASISVREAELLTDQALPLSAKIFSLALAPTATQTD
jgi:hypothetical protein